MSTTNPTSQTTEWDDLQRKFGNLPPLEKEVKEEQLYLEAIDKIENDDILAKKNLKELNQLEESCVDDEYLKIIEKYKKERLNEIRKNKALEIFGDVYEITKDNFVAEINDASKYNPLNSLKDKEQDYEELGMNEEELKKKEENEWKMEKKGKNSKYGTYVVLHLYSENVMACKILNTILIEAAKKYKYVKFAKGVYNKIVENYPESKMPTILIYYNGTCIQQLCNLLIYINGGLANLNLKSFEQLLKKYDVIKIKKNEKHTNGALSEDSDEEDRENRQNFKTQKQYTTFNMFSRKYKNDDDEDDDNSISEKTEKDEVSASKGYASSYFDNQMRRYKM